MQVYKGTVEGEENDRMRHIPAALQVDRVEGEEKDKVMAQTCCLADRQRTVEGEEKDKVRHKPAALQVDRGTVED